jgi:hypothetical protein
MAGVKVTDLPALGTAASDDIMYIVDTSTNQSKKIEVQNLVGGLPDIESGTWNPTPTNSGGTNPIVTILRGNYSRVGSVVTCSLLYELEMDGAESIGQFTLDLPIASNFTNVRDAFGIISYNDLSVNTFSAWLISADTTGNQIEMQVTSTNNGDVFQNIQAILQYVIIP